MCLHIGIYVLLDRKFVVSLFCIHIFSLFLMYWPTMVDRKQVNYSLVIVDVDACRDIWSAYRCPDRVSFFLNRHRELSVFSFVYHFFVWSVSGVEDPGTMLSRFVWCVLSLQKVSAPPHVSILHKPARNFFPTMQYMKPLIE